MNAQIKIRKAVLRLMAAVRKPGITVEVRRDDLALLIEVLARRGEPAPPPSPNLHPAQR